MDASAALPPSTASLERDVVPCPLLSCSKQFKKMKKKFVLKHFKAHHPGAWVLICAHCFSFATRKSRHMARHVKDNHNKGDIPHICTCFSSCQLKETKFEACGLSLQFCCNICQYTTDSVKDFNVHAGSHIQSEIEFNDGTLAECSINEVNTGQDLETGSAESVPISISPCPKLEAKIRHSKLDVIDRKCKSELPDSFIKLEESSNGDLIALHPCPECGKCFTRKRSIKAHMVVHGDERDFHCSQCPYQAKRKGDLEIHIRTFHNQDRPFTCSFCSMQFAFKTNLTRHLRKHNGDKVYKCDVCDKYFSQKFNVSRHMERYHKL